MPMHKRITCRQADELWVQRCSSSLTGTAACALEEKLKGHVPQLALCRSNCEQHDCRKPWIAEQLRRSWQAVGSAMAQPGAARQSHLPSAGHGRVEGVEGPVREERASEGVDGGSEEYAPSLWHHSVLETQLQQSMP